MNSYVSAQLQIVILIIYVATKLCSVAYINHPFLCIHIAVYMYTYYSYLSLLP